MRLMLDCQDRYFVGIHVVLNNGRSSQNAVGTIICVALSAFIHFIRFYPLYPLYPIFTRLEPTLSSGFTSTKQDSSSKKLPLVMRVYTSLSSSEPSENKLQFDSLRNEYPGGLQ